VSPALTPANDAIRAVNVTASEVAALMGPHPYTDPQRIFDRLAAHYHGTPYDHGTQTESMYLGVFFEKRIAQYAAHKLGLRLRACSRTIPHPHYPLAATPDYYVLRKHPLGLRMLVECKLSSIMYGWNETELAPHYEWQARAQLACTDRDVCIVAALVGSKFYAIPVVRDATKERFMLETVDMFFRDMLAGIRPPAVEIPQVRKVTVAG